MDGEERNTFFSERTKEGDHACQDEEGQQAVVSAGDPSYGLTQHGMDGKKKTQ